MACSSILFFAIMLPFHTVCTKRTVRAEAIYFPSAAQCIAVQCIGCRDAVTICLSPQPIRTRLSRGPIPGIQLIAGAFNSRLQKLGAAADTSIADTPFASGREHLMR
jgi:hypothetical protein